MYEYVFVCWLTVDCCVLKCGLVFNVNCNPFLFSTFYAGNRFHMDPRKSNFKIHFSIVRALLNALFRRPLRLCPALIDCPPFVIPDLPRRVSGRLTGLLLCPAGRPGRWPGWPGDAPICAPPAARRRFCRPADRRRAAGIWRQTALGGEERRAGRLSCAILAGHAAADVCVTATSWAGKRAPLGRHWLSW